MGIFRNDSIEFFYLFFRRASIVPRFTISAVSHPSNEIFGKLLCQLLSAIFQRNDFVQCKKPMNVAHSFYETHFSSFDQTIVNCFVDMLCLF